jgi:hypothetical protein
MLIILVALGIIVYRQISVPNISPEQFSEQYELAKHKYEEGKALVELNRERARDVLTESQESLKNLQETLKKGQAEYKKTVGLLNKVEDLLKIARAAYEIEPKIFYDLSLLRDGLTAREMVRSGNKIYIFSPKQKLVAVINLKTKAAEVIAGGDFLKEASKLTLTASGQYITTADGILNIDEPNKPVIEQDEDWGGIVSLEYFGGNIYLLDGKGKIWKYPPTDSGFGEKKNFLKGDQTVYKPSSMAIDGNIWVVGENNIYKYIGGRQDSYYLRGIESPLGLNAIVDKTPEMNNLYVLDRENNRVVVITEKGDFKAEYRWDGLNTVTAFTVLEEEKKAYMLKQDIIYEFELE